MNILLAEDDLRLARAVKRVFEEESHRVKLVGDGRAAYDTARGAEFDVMILDVMLPEMDGFEVCKRLRTDGTHTPVLMLTARTDVQDRVKGLDSGADDYMVKPFAVAELLARVRALGRRGAMSNGGTKLRAGDLTLDISRHSAIRNGHEIELTVKEFQLLELLLRHQGQVLTRAQILDHVWQYDRDFASNVVDIYVHYLRNKVDKGFKTQLIHTVRGVGYTLKP
ncbi:MAG TPA: response regulator transcription factor [Dehalococcoidia bacterium]|jgi:DNA-binding response OmpR family regulator|nr:response regulator transcription factor [Dehalococcoidia bacterium]